MHQAKQTKLFMTFFYFKICCVNKNLDLYLKKM